MASATPEGKVKKGIIDILKKYNIYYFMPVQNGMGAPGLDFHCTVPPKGLSLNIEAKAPGKKPTARQLGTIERMEAAGATCFVCDGNFDELETLIQGL